jgi:alpha-D-ribose 1-methylphosphonate 5-triphosphate synthase subunit PhnL
MFRANGARLDLASAPEVEILALRRNAIGFVSQFFYAIPRLTATTVVAEPLLEQGVEASTAHHLAREMLDRLQIPKALWECYPSTFSGGERQRVNLARALVAPRALILLDEPTASLDPVRRALVLDLLEDLKAKGTALIAVFHDPDRSALVDRTLTLQEANR